jgi:type IV pilus assembly protein PilC
MFFSPRIGLKPLAALCRRQAIGLQAGIDLRTMWAREAGQARSAAARQRFSTASQAIHGGESLTAGLARTGDFFPALFREMIEVGEQSGHLAEVMGQLAEHYEGQLQLRRTFLAAIAWPMVELAAALGVIGLLIWIMGLISQITNTQVDILGFGLVGTPGLLIYLLILAVVGTLGYAAVQAVSRGMIWTRPVQRAVLRVPVLGSALETLALARLAWTMYLTMNAGMKLRRSLELSLRSTRNARYLDVIGTIDAEIARGNSIYDAFCAAGCFPIEFLDALQVGEQSGQLVESMAHLSRQYQEQARTTIAVLAKLTGMAVWALVAAFIIFLIFRVFSFYLGMIKSAMP